MCFSVTKVETNILLYKIPYFRYSECHKHSDSKRINLRSLLAQNIETNLLLHYNYVSYDEYTFIKWIFLFGA